MIWVVFLGVAIWMASRPRPTRSTATVRHVSQNEWAVRWILMIVLILILASAVGSLFH